MDFPSCVTRLLRKCLALVCAATLLLQPVAALAADVTSYTYDEDRAGAFNVGRLTSLGNAAATIRYDHDASGNVVSQRWEVDGQTYTQTFTYAPHGQLLRRTFADNDAIPSATDTYQYDGAGRLQSVPGLITGISFNANSDPIVTTYGNGVVETRAYHADRKWLMSITAQSAGTEVFSESYTRSDKGLITDVASNRANGNWQYGYDTADRLVSATNLDDGLLSQDFRYDAADNITFNSSVGDYVYPAPTDPRPHAVTQAGGQTYSYDAKGNMVSGGGRTITYDGEDRPVSITYNGQTTSFVYAPDGRRLKKITGGQTTLYLGADEEITPAGTHIKHPLSGVRKAGTDINWMHRDHLSSVKLMSDAAGLVISENFFRPYGERSDVQIPALGTPRESKGWIGERDDPETGLTYLNARYYDPVLARFISPDWFNPKSAGVGTNRYAYALNNPIWLKDPGGNDSFGSGNPYDGYDTDNDGYSQHPGGWEHDISRNVSYRDYRDDRLGNGSDRNTYTRDSLRYGNDSSTDDRYAALQGFSTRGTNSTGSYAYQTAENQIRADSRFGQNVAAAGEGAIWGAAFISGLGEVYALARVGLSLGRNLFSARSISGYASRVRARALEDPSSHNFPYSFDQTIVSKGTPNVRSDGYTTFQMPGSMTGKTVVDPATGLRTQQYKHGVYEIGVTPQRIIDHRFFRPN